MRIPARLRAEDCDADVRCLVPVRIERVRILVQEREAGEVGRSAGIAVVQRRVHSPAEMVDGKEIHPTVADDRRSGEVIESPLQARARDPALGGPSSRPHARAGAVRGVRKVEEVGAFGVVELQGPGDRIENRRRDAGQTAALELAVVLDADPASDATSPRRSPGTRRLPYSGMPAC